MTNEMTNKEAVKQIKENCYFASISEKTKQALDMAIKALEQQPCEDCISREHAKQFLYYEIEHLHDDGLYDCFSRIIDDMYNELPSVTPQYTDEEIDKAQAVEQAYVDKMVELAVEETKRPKGKWIDDCGGVKCSCCGYSIDDDHYAKAYCTNCGAEMSGGGEE